MSDVNITVMINEFERVTSRRRPYNKSRTKENNPELELAGFSQCVVMKKPNREMCTANKARENPLDRKTSSLTNLQFTVHLNMNCRVNSKARETYPTGLLIRKGAASKA